MFEALTEPDADGNYDVAIFGEQFSFNSDVNPWLLTLAGTGKPSAIVNLVQSTINVVPEDGEKLDQARRREADRFNEVLGSQRGLTFEDVAELINHLTEVAAGNDQ